MLSKITSCTAVGVSGLLIDVEVDVALGLPTFSTVGLPDSSVRESRDRVKSAIRNCGYEFPNRKITVNLAPADVRKEGAGFDLPTAIGILSATGVISSEELDNICIVGELSLDGKVRKVNGLLPMLIEARDNTIEKFIVPADNRHEAMIAADSIYIIPVSSLPDTVEYLLGIRDIPRIVPDDAEERSVSGKYSDDFSDVKGQQHVKRALEIAASGGHNLLMVGPPGSGKTMLARRLPSILPPMSVEEVIETTKVYSVAGDYATGQGVQGQRPFRAPHHTISDAGLIGGGAIPRPGEVSLAHNGVLFLDELPEFKKHVLEVLRQPLEDGQVTIARANLSLNFPSRFTLITAMNPCPCGFLGDQKNSCTCTPGQVQKYQNKISGPLFDRIDLHLSVSALNYSELTGKGTGESSAVIRGRVREARKIQEKRFSSLPGIFCNGQMSNREIDSHCRLGEQAKKLLERSIEKLSISARGYHRILRIARTIADMSNSPDIETSHLAEAVQYRRNHIS